MDVVEARAATAIDQHKAGPRRCRCGSAGFRAGHRSGNSSIAFSIPSTPQSPAEQGWGWRSAGPSSMPMAADYGQRRTNLAAPYFGSPSRREKKELMNCPGSASGTGEPHEDTPADASRQPVFGR